MSTAGGIKKKKHMLVITTVVSRTSVITNIGPEWETTDGGILICFICYAWLEKSYTYFTYVYIRNVGIKQIVTFKSCHQKKHILNNYWCFWHINMVENRIWWIRIA